MSSEYLKRGAGKIKGDIKKKDFYKFYKENSFDKKLPVSVYNKFLNSLLKELSTKIVTDSLEVRLTNLGIIRVRSKKLTLVKTDGTIAKTLRADWKATWEYWHEKWPKLTRDEIIKIEGKKVIHHTNDHTQGEFYEHFWDRTTCKLSGQNLYEFEAPRQYSRLISQTVKNPNRKTFYYA